MRFIAFTLALALPSLVFAQAEPAPPDYVPPSKRGVPPPPPTYTPPRPPEDANVPKWNASVKPRLVVTLADGPPGLPRVGYGGGVALGRALLPIGRARFGVGAAFAYDRVSRDGPSGGTQSLSHASFAFLLQLDAIIGRLRPFFTLGGGFSVGVYEDTTTPAIVSEVGVAGLVQVGAGLAVRVFEQLELGLRGEVDVTLSPATIADPPISIFQPGHFALSLDIGFRF
jgi:hypothetical protein